jgi:hypothetical protein
MGHTSLTSGWGDIVASNSESAAFGGVRRRAANRRHPQREPDLLRRPVRDLAVMRRPVGSGPAPSGLAYAHHADHIVVEPLLVDLDS